MKKALLPATLICSLLVGPSSEARADTAIIKIRNVTPRLVAWWLDPAHQPVPFEKSASHRGEALPPEFLAIRMPQETMFTLPAGIQKIAAIDPQNAIEAVGSAAALDELRGQIKALDNRVRQVEVESFLVAVDAPFVKQFGIDFQPVDMAEGKGAAVSADAIQLRSGKVRNNFRATLKALEDRKNATVIAAPRVSAIEYLPASIAVTTSTPLVLPPSSNGLLPEFKAYTSERTGMVALPIIQPDDSVKLMFSPLVDRGISVFSAAAVGTFYNPWEKTPPNTPAANANAFSSGDTKYISLGFPRTVVTSTVLDGDTFAVTDFAPPAAANTGQTAGQKPGKQFLFFVTPRIIRYVDDPMK